jgi:DNA repair protein RecN (Recombination protein N)
LQDLQAAAELIAEAAGNLDRFLDGFQVDPRDLDELEDRKALYEDLQRKHRRNVTELLVLRDQLGERLARQDEAASDLAQLADACEAARDELARVCHRLHAARCAGAAQVAAAAETVIRPLALAQLELAFAIEPQADPDGPIELEGARCRVAAHGADAVRLLVRTNPGEAMGEAGAIASGGEAARIHLGLTVLCRGRQRPLVQLFDEVDAGLGMDAATPVAWLLRDLAEHAQAICITHLPTVAVHARQHWLVTKEVRGGRTVVDLTELQGDQRIDEVARQLGGEGWRRGDAAAQLAYARELLAAAGTG